MSTDYAQAHQEFVDGLREIIEDEESDDSDVIDYILDALRGDVDAGDISDLIHDRYVTEKISQRLDIEAQQLVNRMRRSCARRNQD